VKPSNAGEIVKQWLDVHGLPSAPMSEQIIDGYPRQVWWNADGETVIESYMITDMAHGAPLSRSEGGVTGPYMIEAGVSSSDYIAKFFGLTDASLEASAKLIKQRLPPLFDFLRKTTCSLCIRAVRSWRDARANVARIGRCVSANRHVEFPTSPRTLYNGFEKA